MQLESALAGEECFTCKTSLSSRAASLFESDWEANWHIVNLLRLKGIEATVRDIDGNPQLLTFGQPNAERLFAYGNTSPEYEILIEPDGKIPVSSVNETSYPVARRIFSSAIRSIARDPLRVDTFDIYDSSIDLASKIRSDLRTDPILAPIRVHPGISYQFRTFDGKPYAQFLPKSRIVYGKNIAEMLREGLKKSEIIDLFPYGIIPNLRAMRMIEISDLSTEDVIRDEPFNGRSFSQLASDFYPLLNLPREGDSLVRVASPMITYFPSNWIRPSVTFTGISFLSEGYYSQLISLLKLQGKERPNVAKSWARRLSPLKFGRWEIDISQLPKSMGFQPQPCEASQVSKMNTFNTAVLFAPPSVNFLRDGEEIEVYPGMQNYQATVNDLLSRPELKPLEVPSKLRFMVFIDKNLFEGWQFLKKSISEGKGEYRGFKETFGSSPSFDEVIITDFLSKEFPDRVDKLNTMSYDCAIIIIPRHFQTQAESKKVYVTVKTQIMEKGIPVQVITDQQKITFGRNSTLRGKSESAFAVFGIAINLLAKSGSVLTSLSDSSTSNLMNDSVVMGYNVARIVTQDIRDQRTTPIAAPLVIFDAKGAYVSHQGVYRLWNEVSLFEQWGDEIFDSLPNGTSSLIVHKDGFFHKSELNALQQLGKSRDITTVPVSVRTSHVPRVFNPAYYGNDIGLKAGSVLPLSSEDVLMVTTPISTWDPSRQGWPNPIMITLHGLSGSTQIALKILYHMFSLTKMQVGSQRPVRTPVSIHYANMIAKFLTKAGETTPRFLQYFVRPQTGKRSIPRWFQ